jgi:nucleoside-diphosphate-sugar epimerase
LIFVEITGEDDRVGFSGALRNPLAADLDHVLRHTQGVWEPLRGQRIFVTGGTGFFGRWLMESFVRANDALDLQATAFVLTRNPSAFRTIAPHLAAHRAVQLYAGDFTSFEFPGGAFHSVLHAATEPEFAPRADAPLGVFDANLRGCLRVLDLARVSGASRFLFASSGAAYGRQPPEMSHLPEEYAGAPDTMDAASAYGQSKRACEFMCAMYARQFGFSAPIARCFAFAGPFLPLNLNFAIGNFVRDALAGGPIRIGGDGTPRRSYLYAADLAVWLWTILLRGDSCRVYNVGSDSDLSIAELAAKVAGVVAPGAEVVIAKKSVPGAPVMRYVPSVARADRELGLKVLIPLEEGIRRMAELAASHV